MDKGLIKRLTIAGAGIGLTFLGAQYLHNINESNELENSLRWDCSYSIEYNAELKENLCHFTLNKNISRLIEEFRDGTEIWYTDGNDDGCLDYITVLNGTTWDRYDRPMDGKYCPSLENPKIFEKIEI